MAKCPNCDTQVVWDATECGACRAFFGGGSQWKPVGESREEKQNLRARYGEVAPRDPSNPYAPPDASVEDAVTEARQSRPAWVWVITVFYGVGMLWNVISLVMITTGTMPMDEAGRAYWDSLNAFDHTLTVVSNVVSLVGLVLLFLMRARATTFLMASLVISALSSVYTLATKNLVAAAGVAGLVGMVIGFLVWAAVIWYAYHLRDSGRLR